jgi:uncharacterized protein (AIM24 family)
VAEDIHRERRRTVHEAAGEPPQDSSLAATYLKLDSAELDAVAVADALAGALVSPVITAHPTETRRRTVFEAQNRITELMRFRGRPTERSFGEGATRMHRASGDGALLYAASGRRFTALELDGDAAYLREERVFGFEDGLAFENGRVPSASGAELSLVHLRGRGGMLLVTAGAPLALEVTPSAPVRLPLAALVGWTGALTPRLAALAEEGAGAGTPVVELSGEGRVLADPEAVGEGAP